jgi:glycosyltransferase involved in cell wall biosynthesis
MFTSMKSDLYSDDLLNFVTVFPAAEGFHLFKDVGQIPYIFAKEFGMNGLLATETGSSFDTVLPSTPGLKILPLKRAASFRGIRLSAFLYLLRESKRIQVLNLYHLSLETKLLSLLYRFRNPGGFLYIKLDVNLRNEIAALKQAPRRNPIRRMLGQAFHAAFYRAVDVVSAESREAVDVVQRRYPSMAGKVIHVTNGLESHALPHDIDTALAAKEDLMITVGRIGDYYKNNELLLDALKQVQLEGWKVAIIGPYTEAFEKKFSALLAEYPHLRDAVELVGNIANRQALMQWYARARVLILTSRSEGFPLVFPEAQCYGNFILSTDVSSVREVTGYGTIGEVVPSEDAQALAAALRRLVGERARIAALHSDIAQDARARYDWRHALAPLKAAIDRHYHA